MEATTPSMESFLVRLTPTVILMDWAAYSHFASIIRDADPMGDFLRKSLVHG